MTKEILDKLTDILKEMILHNAFEVGIISFEDYKAYVVSSLERNGMVQVQQDQEEEPITNPPEPIEAIESEEESDG